MTNEAGIPSDAFSGGAVVFGDNAPLQLAQQVQARQQAKDEALSKYYLNLPQTINDAGVRQIDEPAFRQKVDNIRQYYLNNADAIKNPRLDKGVAYQNYNRLFDDANAHVNASVQRGKNQQEFARILSDPAKRALMPESAVGIAHNLEQPITDKSSYKPTGEDYSLADIDFNPTPVGEKDWNAFNSPYAKRIQQNGYEYGKPTETVDPKTFTKTTTIPKTLKPQIATDILMNIASKYHNSPSWKKYGDDRVKEVVGDDEQYDKYNKLYKQFYPNQGDVREPEHLLAAEAISRMGLDNQTQDTYKTSNYNPNAGKGRSGGSASSGWVYGAANAIKSGDASKIGSYLNSLYGGNTNTKYSGFDMQPNGHIVIHSTPTTKRNGIDIQLPKKDIDLDPNDPALVDKVLGVYQDHLGSDPKTERSVVNDVQPNNTAKPVVKPKVNWVN